MGLRGCAAILLSEAIFSGYAGYWILSIGTAVLFVCDSFTMIETDMPFRDPRVWESVTQASACKSWLSTGAVASPT
jgi:hypothetical protein